MKVAFHFDEDKLGDAEKVLKPLLAAARRMRLPIHSRLFVGSLLVHSGAAKRTRRGSTITEKTDRNTLQSLIEQWLSPQPFNWYALLPRASEVVCSGTVYCVLLETIEPHLALRLHVEAQQMLPDVYLGALQVDESIPSHLAGYQLVAWARLDGDRAFVMWDGVDEDAKMPWVIEMLRDSCFDPVEYEDIGARFTMFDRHASAEATHRAAQSRAALAQLFDGVVDAAVVRVRDAMPDVHERLWAVLRSYYSAEVDEQFSAVALGCRRLIEYAADSMFPPTKAVSGGRKLDQAAFKNRLLKYLEEKHASNNDRDLIVASLAAIAGELDRLVDLTNKGVHSSSNREQCRRCLLRTVMLLDDLCAVTHEGFPVRVSLDRELVDKIAGRRSPKARSR